MVLIDQRACLYYTEGAVRRPYATLISQKIGDALVIVARGWQLDEETAKFRRHSMQYPKKAS
jgi:hypothetical protein